MRINFFKEFKKLVVTLIAVFVAGFVIGQMLGRYVVEPSAAIYYQKSLQGKVYIESLPGIDGKCPYQPNDDYGLDSAVVTDGELLGYPLGSTDFFNFDLQPVNGRCSYGEEFSISISPTGTYELAFNSNADSASENIPIFVGVPEPSVFLWGNDDSITPTWLRWLLTTVSCPNSQTICIRE